jgi:hypothetical protein
MSKAELVEAINSYTAARLSGDPKLMQFGAETLQQVIASLDIPDTPESDDFDEDVELTDAEILEDDN